MTRPDIPTGPVEFPPTSFPHPTAEHLRAALEHVLRGVDLGVQDKRTAGWAIRFLDAPTVLVLASWVERARTAERAAIVRDLDHELEIVKAGFDAIDPSERGDRVAEEFLRAGLGMARTVVVNGSEPLLYVRGRQLRVGDVLDGRAYPDQPEELANRKTVLSIDTVDMEGTPMVRAGIGEGVFRVFDPDAEILIWRSLDGAG